MIGICPNGVDIHCDASDIGLAFTLIPKVGEDWGSLIGFKGKNISAVREIMKIWRAKHAPNLSIHVWTPSPRKIKD